MRRKGGRLLLQLWLANAVNGSVAAVEGFSGHRAEYGVYTIPGDGDGHGLTALNAGFDMPCTDCMVTRAQVQLRYGDGSVADEDSGVLLHHLVLSNLARRDGACPERPVGERFFACGSERTVLDLWVER